MFRNTLITGGSFTHVENRQINIKGGFERLQDAAAPGAFHNSGERFDPPKCHPNTRVALLKKLMDWILRQDRRTQNALMMWLYGPAGAGKSAIAQTLAEMCHAEGRLLASFFFSRNDAFRGTAHALVATIAYQLCLNLPQQVYHRVVGVIENDPLIFSRSLEAQLVALVVEPVKDLASGGFFDDSKAPRLIIIDGLDECDKSEVQRNILRTIFQLLRRQDIPLLFLIASRPRRYISSFFESPSVTSILGRLALDNHYGTSEDIRLFLEARFEDIKNEHPLADFIPMAWPDDEALDTLVERTSGQFIYASTVIKFIEVPSRRPTDQLDIVLGITPPSRESPFADLDALYTQVFSWVDNTSKALQIIGLLILEPPLRFSRPGPMDMETYLFLEPGDRYLYLEDLRSLIALEGSLGPRILHASLKDFLLDESRSKVLYLNVEERHTEYALFGFRHIFSEEPPVFFRRTGILGRLFHHAENALPTPEIQDNVSKFTLGFLLDFLHSHYREITDWFPVYLSFLENLSWDNDRSLYKAQVKALDDFFIRHLETYFSTPFLFLAVTVYQNLDFIPDFRPTFPKACEAIDKSGICLQIMSKFRSCEDYRKLLTNLLEDPVRSGEYFLDGEKYADAAIVALTYLSNHWSHPIPRVRSDLDRNIRRKKPRRWREKWGRHSVLPVAMGRMKRNLRQEVYRHAVQSRPDSNLGSAAQQSKVYFNTCKYPYEKEKHARGVFRFVLTQLPHVLKRAGRLDRLLEIARQFEFGSRAKTCRKLVRLGRKAIGELLDRFSEEPKIDKMDVDEQLMTFNSWKADRRRV